MLSVNMLAVASMPIEITSSAISTSTSVEPECGLRPIVDVVITFVMLLTSRRTSQYSAAGIFTAHARPALLHKPKKSVKPAKGAVKFGKHPQNQYTARFVSAI